MRGQQLERQRAREAFRPSRTSPRAFTLIEILVVLVIIMMLSAAAIPVLAPALEGRRQREASRLLTSYLVQARDTAIRTGRPAGVMFERFTGGGSASAANPLTASNPIPEMCITVWQCEVPPPYSGDSLFSVATVVGVPGGGVGTVGSIGANNTPDGVGLIRLGDFIKFNGQGHLYQITVGTPDPSNLPYLSPPSSNPWTIVPVGGTTNTVPSLTNVPYQILRQPVKSSAPPLQLPDSIVVDLGASGDQMVSYCPLDEQNRPTMAADTDPVMLVFSPNGSLYRLYAGQSVVGLATSTQPTLPQFLLLAAREKVPSFNFRDPVASTTSVGTENWRDPTSLWITIFPQTGQITSTENAPVPNFALDNTNLTNAQTMRLNGLMAARRMALEGQTLGGR